MYLEKTVILLDFTLIPVSYELLGFYDLWFPEHYRPFTVNICSNVQASYFDASFFGASPFSALLPATQYNFVFIFL